MIPNTGCKQVKKPVCTDPVCPLIVENEVCSDIEKTVRKVTKGKVAWFLYKSFQFVRKVPKETCEIHPREVCFDIEKQYPKLKMHSECQYLPRETCTPERVRPKEINRPVIKKICTKSDGSSTDDDNESPSIPSEKGKNSKFTKNKIEIFLYKIKDKNWQN